LILKMTNIFLSLYIYCSLLDMLWLINIKLVGNWASWFSSGLEFNELRVWDFSSSLKGPLLFAWFIFIPFFFQLMFFQFHHLAFISLVVMLCFFFICLVYGFLWVFKTTQIILNLFICCFFLQDLHSFFSLLSLCPEFYFLKYFLKHTSIARTSFFIDKKMFWLAT